MIMSHDWLTQLHTTNKYATMCRLKGSISWVCLMAICITPYTLTSMALRVFCMPYPPPIPFMGFKTRLVSSPPIKSPTPSKPLSPINS